MKAHLKRSKRKGKGKSVAEAWETRRNRKCDAVFSLGFIKLYDRKRHHCRRRIHRTIEKECFTYGEKTVLVIADLGGRPPHMFYKSAAEKYNLVSFIPRPFAITASHARLIEKYSVAVIKDKDYFQSLADFEHPDSIYWAHEDHDKPEEEVVEQIVKVAEMFGADAITTNNELFIAPMAKACERLGLRVPECRPPKMPEIKIK